jgi:hypothetical protein
MVCPVINNKEGMAERRIQIMIRRVAAGKYRLYSRKKNPKTGKQRNLGTFDSREEAREHEREIQYFKHP